MGSIKRPPRIALEIRKDYSKLSKSDLIEVCLSFAQMIYGEDLSATDLMEKIKEEKATINQNNNY